MNSKHYKAATDTASTRAARFDRDVSSHDPESLSVYGSLLLRGAIAAAQQDNRRGAHELLTGGPLPEDAPWSSLATTLRDVTFKTCYQPHPADRSGSGGNVAHAVDNSDPNISVAREPLRADVTMDDWPGRGPACHTCADALGVDLSPRP